MTHQSATNPHRPPVRFARYENLPPHTERQPIAPALRAGYRKQANDLVQAAEGIVVAEFIDHAPRRTAWRQRPAARALLDQIALEPGERGFDAVLIPDPATALYQANSAVVPAILAHYALALWTPLTAGPLDLLNDVHLRLLATVARPGGR